MKNKFLLSSLILLGALSLTGCNFTYNYIVPAYPGGIDLDIGEDTGIDDAGSYSIKIWCDERIMDLTETQIGNFVTSANGKYKIDYKIDKMSEGDAASSMTEDVEQGADIYVFAQDQLNKLKTAGALAPITGDMKDAVVAESSEEAINAATINDKLYALPFTSDNGYFLMYDKTYINDEDAKSMEKIIEICENKNLTFNYSVFTNGFYSASYFMSQGIDCESKWFINSANKFYRYEDNYNSDKGLIACKGLQYLKNHNIFAGKDDPSKFGKGLGACVTGIWNYGYAKNILGDKLGCAEMPSFKVDGVSYHISSFSGYKLIGVKPQTDSKKVSVCKRIARYLSGQTCQTERFNKVSYGPTNEAVKNLDAVKSNEGLKALWAQQVYSKPQVQCPSSWFSSVSSLASNIDKNSTDSQLRALLKQYEENLDTLLE